MNEAVPYTFVGVTNRAQRRGAVLDLLGLGHVLPLTVLPHSLGDLQTVFAVPTETSHKRAETAKIHITMRDKTYPHNIATLDLQIDAQSTAPDPDSASKTNKILNMLQLVSVQGPSGVLTPQYQLITLPSPPLVVTEPTEVHVEVQFPDSPPAAGDFICTFVESPHLTEEERRAIMSRPEAYRELRVQVQCTPCRDEISFHLALDPERRERVFDQKAIWLRDAPDVWKCQCGRTVIPTRYMRIGLPNLFRRAPKCPGPISFSFTRLYERAGVAKVEEEYRALLTRSPAEEEVQCFLENHSLLWGFLSPIKILHKPPILTRKKADFGIFTASKTLYLVEIEKPQTKLAKKNGGVHAEFQAGLDQLRDWRVTVEDHRGAVLNELGFQPDDVHSIRYMLIAGLAGQTSQESLITLRRNPPGDIEFYCFDELASFLHRLSAELDAI
jgi:hypothetical protein